MLNCPFRLTPVEEGWYFCLFAQPYAVQLTEGTHRSDEPAKAGQG